MSTTNIEVVKLAQPVLSNPVLVQGLPGLGFVGKIAVDFLIDQLKPVKFAEVYSSYIALPDGEVGVKVELDSTFTLPRYELYAYEKEPNLILMTGDTQPTPWGQYNVSKSVLDIAEGYGCKTLVALGGYALRRQGADAIYAVASEPAIVGELREKFNVQPAQSGTIKGAFGVLLGLGKGRNLKCLGLLGATAGAYPDLLAARNVIRLLASLYNLPIDAGGMDKKIEDMENRVKRLKNISAAPTAGEGRETNVPHGYIS